MLCVSSGANISLDITSTSLVKHGLVGVVGPGKASCSSYLVNEQGKLYFNLMCVILLSRLQDVQK